MGESNGSGDLFQEYGQTDKILNNFEALKTESESAKIIQNFVSLAIFLEQTTIIVIFALSNTGSETGSES